MLLKQMTIRKKIRNNKVKSMFTFYRVLSLFIVVIIGITLIQIVRNSMQDKKLFHDIVLEDDVVIGSEWHEISVDNLINIDRDRCLIGIFLEPPFEEPYEESGIKTPSGEVIIPEIILVDSQGAQYMFTHSGSRGIRISNYKYNGILPRDKSYTKVYLRSAVTIKAKKILWSSYNIKDLK